MVGLCMKWFVEIFVLSHAVIFIVTDSKSVGKVIKKSVKFFTYLFQEK